VPVLLITEVLATLTGFLCVLFFIRQIVWAWPVAVVSATLFGIVFLDAGLYSNMGLQGLYVVLAFYGWYQWRRGGPDSTGVTVKNLTALQGVVLGTVALLAAAALIVALVLITRGSPVTIASIIDFITSENARSLDALATAMSLAATWMQAKKILENWLLWIVIDTLLTGVFLSQELYFTAALYLLYLVMATLGYQAWRRDCHNGKRPQAFEES